MVVEKMIQIRCVENKFWFPLNFYSEIEIFLEIEEKFLFKSSMENVLQNFGLASSFGKSHEHNLSDIHISDFLQIWVALIGLREKQDYRNCFCFFSKIQINTLKQNHQNKNINYLENPFFMSKHIYTLRIYFSLLLRFLD